ncbi:MAG: right-handed parallel beta-helix repeat-containing protein, partial [Planctomycetota bacterium]
DRNVMVNFELITGRKLHVPSEYPLLQDAIDASRYRDTIVLAAGGADDPYKTSRGYLIRDNKAITITSVDPNDPATVAATVIEMEAIPDTAVDSAFTFINVGRDTILNGITIRGFHAHALDGEDGDDELEPGYNGGPAAGIGLVCYDASPTIKNCVIYDCNIEGGDGGNGMPGTELHPDGMAGGWPGGAYGAGLCAFAQSDPLVINCTFDNLRVHGGNGGDGGDGQDAPPGPQGVGGRGGGWFYGTNSYWYNFPWPFAYSITDVFRGFSVPGGRPGFYDFYTMHGALGGAVYIGPGCSATIRGCTFSNNSTRGGLSGICGLIGAPTSLRLEPGLRWRIDNFGGAVFCDENSSVVFEDCTFSNNIADPCRPIRDLNEPPSETNYDNDDVFVGFGGAVAFKDNAQVTFENCTFDDNSGDKGGAMHWVGSDPVISNCRFEDNTAQSGGALIFSVGLGSITGSDFVGNEASGEVARGGAICSLGSNAFIKDCRLTNNSADESGGGIYVSRKDAEGNDLIIEGERVLGYNKVVLQNCLITNNSAGEDGGGVSAYWDSDPNIINCTIAHNIATGVGADFGLGGGLSCWYGSQTNVIDSIIWGNSASFGNQIAIGLTSKPSTVTISSSNVEGAQSGAYIETGCTLNWDPNNLYVDPLFVAGPFGDYYLTQIAAGQSQDSPSVDAGSDFASRVGMSRYATRTDEIFDRGLVDMGYHHPYSAKAEPCRFTDLFYDHMINFNDYAIFAVNWLREGCSHGNNWCADSDFTFNTTVGVDDLYMFVECWLVEDTNAPVPNPSRWAIEPYSNSLTSIKMTAETAEDTWGGDVEYYFECAYGNCNDSGWVPDTSYTDSGLVGHVEYGYRVKAHDDHGNETEWSPTRFAITSDEPPPPPDNNPPTPDPMTWATPPQAVSETSVRMTATLAHDDTSDVQYYFEELTGQIGADDSGWIENRTYTDTGLMTGSTYRYRVRARDTSVQRNMTAWSVEVEATPETGAEPNEPSDDTNPPAPVLWEVAPWESGSGFNAIANMMAAEAFDPEGAGVQYKFQCVDAPSLSSPWMDERVWIRPVGQAMRGLRWRFRVRDTSPNLNKSAWSTTLPCYPPF